MGKSGKPLVLVTNDDGIHAPGLAVLAEELKAHYLVRASRPLVARATSSRQEWDYQVISRIHTVRGHKVMLDSDLAELYQVETRRLNEQVKRNSVRFPKDFMFELTGEVWEDLKSQYATSSWGGRRTPLTGASVTPVSGTSYKLAPGMGQRAMGSRGGLDKVGNKRREVSPERMEKLEKKYGK